MQEEDVIYLKESKNVEDLIHEAAHIYHKKIGNILTKEWLEIGYRQRKEPNSIFGTKQMIHENAFFSEYASFDYTLDFSGAINNKKGDYIGIEFKKYGILWGFNPWFSDNKEQISWFLSEKIKQLPKKFGKEIKMIFINPDFEKSHVIFEKMEENYSRVCEDIAESTCKIYTLENFIEDNSLEINYLVEKTKLLSEIRNKIENKAIKRKIKILAEYNFITEKHIEILKPHFLESRLQKESSNLIFVYNQRKKSQEKKEIKKHTNIFLSCENF